jgi:hypothetical protein
MQTITTKYIGATNTKRSRIKATTADGVSIMKSWNYDLDTMPNHQEAARQLIEKMGWHKRDHGRMAEWAAGSTKTGYVWVIVDSRLGANSRLVYEGGKLK